MNTAISSMRDKLQDLEKASMPLEPSASEREAVRSRVIDYAEDFLNNIGSIKTFNTSDTKGIGSARLADHGERHRH